MCDTANGIHIDQSRTFAAQSQKRLVREVSERTRKTTDLFEGQFAGELLGEEDHPRHPEEDDVVAGFQQCSWEEALQVHRLQLCN